MALIQPKVVGPLSELCATIRVQGQLPGSTVTVVSTKPDLCSLGAMRHQVMSAIKNEPWQTENKGEV